MAEGLIRARLEGEGLAEAVEVSSAGTWAISGRPATPTARQAMSELGIDLSAHRSRELETGLLGAADLILVMTEAHREAIAVEFPDSAPKLRLMSSLEGGGWDVLDPVGQPIDRYRATRDELARLIDRGWAAIVGNAQDPRGS